MAVRLDRQLGALHDRRRQQNYGVISMPNEWGVGDNREIYETSRIELGHNLGMGDQYTSAVPTTGNDVRGRSVSALQPRPPDDARLGAGGLANAQLPRPDGGAGRTTSPR